MPSTAWPGSSASSNLVSLGPFAMKHQSYQKKHGFWWSTPNPGRQAPRILSHVSLLLITYWMKWRCSRSHQTWTNLGFWFQPSLLQGTRVLAVSMSQGNRSLYSWLAAPRRRCRNFATWIWWSGDWQSRMTDCLPQRHLWSRRNLVVPCPRCGRRASKTIRKVS